MSGRIDVAGPKTARASVVIAKFDTGMPRRA